MAPVVLLLDVPGSVENSKTTYITDGTISEKKYQIIIEDLFLIRIQLHKCDISEGSGRESTQSLGLWRIKPFSTIFPLYRGGQFYW